jgi:drug/metabolite transporter (DMT)-like permease
MAGIDVFTFMFYSMLSSALFLLAVSGFTGDNLIHFPLKVWLCFIGMGVHLPAGTGWLTINYSLRYMESTRVAIALLSQTVFAGILAAFLLDEHLSVTEIIGSVIVLAGIAVTFLKPKCRCEFP